MNKIFLMLIILIAVFFRFNQLSSIPAHPSLDEVSIGYNAYSILRTGADEYGNKFPILLRAYDDWRPSLYVYLVIPFVNLLGLNVLSVRLPSVILSILTIIAVYFFMRELFSKRGTMRNYAEIISLVVVFLLAISPWHIYISRLGHEVNAGFSFFIFALLFFFRYIRNADEGKNSMKYSSSDPDKSGESRSYLKNNKSSRQDRTIMSLSNLSIGPNLIISAIFFGLSFDSYQSTKIVIPLILILLFILFYKILLLNKKTFILSCLIGVLIILPIVLESFKPYGLARFQGTNVFSSQQVIDISAKRIMFDVQERNFFGLIFDNRRLDYAFLFVRSYLSHFNPSWLFTNQGGEEFKIPSFGLFHLFELFLIVFGTIFLVKSDLFGKKIKLFLLFWLLIGILPSAITTGFPHAMRIYNILPVPQIIGTLGIVYLFNIYSQIKNFKQRCFTASFLIFVIIFSTLWLYHSYFTNFKRELSYQFQYGVLEALSFAKENENSFDKIIVSNQKQFSQSYMFYLFLNQYDPFEYQKFGGTKTAGFNATHKIGKYEFGNVDVDNLNALYVLNIDELPRYRLKIIKTVKTLDGTESLWIAVKK